MMMTCLMGEAVLIASTALSASSPARVGAPKPKKDMENVSAHAVILARHFFISCIHLPPSEVVLEIKPGEFFNGFLPHGVAQTGGPSCGFACSQLLGLLC